MNRVQDKVVIITGGASGIGRAAAELFVAEGAKVVIADIADEAGAQLEAMYPGVLRYQRTDVTSEPAVAALVASAVATFGKLDVFYNNAGGTSYMHTLFDLETEPFDKVLALNLRAVVMGHKYAARQFRQQGTGGSIVTTVSASALQGNIGPAAYAIAKHGVTGIIHQAVAELAPFGIRSNGIAPGTILTPAIGRMLSLPEEQLADYNVLLNERSAAWSPMGRLGQPQDIAYAALFFASDESSWITGTVLPVDGGQTSAFGGKSFGAIAVETAAEFAKRG